MKSSKGITAALLAVFVVLMSLPWLVPHLGFLALVGLVPLLCAERIAHQTGIRRFCLWYYLAFLLWNALTTWWVCEATVGGGIFASVVNALMMALLFGAFRISRRSLTGILPYVFLAALWIAWERWYCNVAQISWPWLVLGNAFARSTSLIQWYEYTGHLGGSLWIWSVNLGVFGLMVSLSEGRWWQWNTKGRFAAAAALTAVVALPVISSLAIYSNYQERDDAGQLEVVMAQSSFDPYQKRSELPQAAQNQQAIELFKGAMGDRCKPATYPSAPLLMMIPETFTSDILLNDIETSPSWQTFQRFISDYPDVNLLMGASTYKVSNTASAPSILARKYGSSWIESHNSAILTDTTRRADLYHKSKLVVGTELTPYPKLFVPLDDWLSRKMGVRGLMGRCMPQDEVSTLDVIDYGPAGMERGRHSLAPVICYESIYGEFCTGYIKKGAEMIAVITNDGWWGDTPGYRQHFSYSRLRAIELRRDIARCANTGISAFIDQKGDVLQQSTWWAPEALRGTVNLSREKTFFVRNGDITGRLCTFVAVLLLVLFAVNLFSKK